MTTRQYRWQLKQLAHGRCRQCGKKRSVKSQVMCLKCLMEERMRGRRRLATRAVVGLLLCLVGSQAAMAFPRSTFSWDEEGWGPGEGESEELGVQWAPAAPDIHPEFRGDGFLEVRDLRWDTTGHLFAPGNFLGDWRSYSSFSYRIKLLTPRTVGSGFGRIQLHGDDVNATYENTQTFTTDWQGVGVPLTAKDWNTTDAVWDRLTANVRSMNVIVDAGEFGSVGFDDAQLNEGASTQTPEPATLALMGMGFLGLYRRKKKLDRAGA